MKAVLISGHAADADRKTGFHFWADILARRGWDVDFLTVGVSPISTMKKNGKQLPKPYNQWVMVKDRFRKFIWMPVIHPLYVGEGLLSKLTSPIFSLYPEMMPKVLTEPLSQADLFIVENGCGLMLVPTLAKLNPSAKFIYNFSDRFGVVKFHPVVEESQRAALPYFSFIRLNSSSFKKDFPADVETHYIPQSLDKTAFDQDLANPYTTGKNAVSIGDMIFDPKVIERLADSFPDWNFHLFGKGARLGTSKPNVREYGEVPFGTLVPYLKHADIALAPYNNSPNAEYLSESSLKMVQYTYCQLPIVAPDFAAKGRAHVVPYKIDGMPSAEDAFRSAMTFDRSTIDKSAVMSWDDVVDVFLSAPKKTSLREAVLMVTSRPDALCGVADYTRKLANAMQDAGIRVSLEERDRWSFRAFHAIKRKYKGRKDISFHLQYPSLGMGNSVSPAYFAALCRSAPFYVTLHEFSIFSLRRKLMFILSAPFIDKIIFTNDYEHNVFLKYAPFARPKTVVIPIGSNISVTAAPVEKSTLPERLVYFGQISPDKGVDFFLDCVARLRHGGNGMACAMIGSFLDADGDLAKTVKQAVQEHGIQLLNNLPAEDVSEELSRSTIALLPFPDGITEKRGSAFACLKHGLTVITCHSHKTPDWLAQTTYRADTPDSAVTLINEITGGVVERHPNLAKLDIEMTARLWPAIASEHRTLYTLTGKE